MRSRTVRARSSARPSGSRFGRRSRRAASVARASPTRPKRGEGGADPLLVRVDLDELAAELKRVLLRRLGAELRADDEHRVRALDELPERRLVAGRAGGKLVILGEGALAHVRRHDRSAQRLGNGAQLLPGSRAKDAAPGPDQRSLGAREHARRLVESRRVRHDRRGRASVETVDSQIGLAREHVHRDLQEDRAARRRLRPLPGLSEKLGNVLGASCPRRPLHDGLERRALVAQLVEVPAAAADQVARDLARDRDERDVRARGLHEAGQGVQRSGAGGEEQGRRLAACARVAVGGEGGVQLGAEADVADRASA